jgi:hypothetical protein
MQTPREWPRLRSVLRHLLRFLRVGRSKRECGDFFLDEPPPPGSFVREPRRPKPHSPSGTAMLELPDTDAA